MTEPGERGSGSPNLARVSMRRRNFAWAALLVLFAIVAAGLVLAGDRAGDSAGPERGVTLRQLVEEPAAHVGTVVTVSGEVDEWLLPQPETGFTFVVGDEADADILVVPARPEVVPRGLDGDDVVRVTGEVGRVAPDRDAGDDLLGEGGILERHAGSPSIRATRIERLLEPSR